jgi:divalent metal cation (Fe/Co/Zn/Cd) transporter
MYLQSGPVSMPLLVSSSPLTSNLQFQSYFVEVDIVMDANTPLWKAHDLSQQLQDKIETLPDVERAFVHVDHETSHRPVRHLLDLDDEQA